jgi:16S rRNA processing protein RimM
MGTFGRPHGIRGLVRVASHTADPTALTSYGPLRTADGRRFLLEWRGGGIASVAEIVGETSVPILDRETAGRLANRELFIEREQLPAPPADEYYLADLVGLAAFDETGAELGRVAAVHDFGAGASLEVARAGAAPLLLPFTRAAVPAVDIAGGRITVAPPAEVDVDGEAAA